ncbi:hypothetical protein L873DRAFT_1921894 [Choiromyces venosus 120613-1]|uniref:Uncharacterized protein n=1 Tax=Choiromyces venosus 120613-1 TaxID=1336337 RepID=A0A3N4K2B0_9PEZI|nr:hypothetical protein L873DRAFT_1921894 [Choiromyces venosus 120613-1]
MIKKAGYCLKPDKCSFGNEFAEFLRITVDSHGVQMLQYKVHAICSWPLPLISKDMRSFVSLAGVF